MTHDQRLEIAGAPCRVVHEGDPSEAGSRGTVLFYHGLGAEIAGQTKELLSLAAAGFLVVGVDAVGHGVRRWSDFGERFSHPRSEVEDTFREVVRASVAEIPGLLDALIERGWSRPERFGIGGISMGGILTYLAIPREPRLRVATPILGSPRWMDNAPDSPHLHPEAFPPVALLSQTGGADRNVPPEPAREFHQDLAPRYRERGQEHRLGYVEWEGCEHFFPEREWELLWANVVAWYQRFLARDE